MRSLGIALAALFSLLLFSNGADAAKRRTLIRRRPVPPKSRPAQKMPLISVRPGKSRSPLQAMPHRPRVRRTSPFLSQIQKLERVRGAGYTVKPSTLALAKQLKLRSVSAVPSAPKTPKLNLFFNTPVRYYSHSEWYPEGSVYLPNKRPGDSYAPGNAMVEFLPWAAGRYIVDMVVEGDGVIHVEVGGQSHAFDAPKGNVSFLLQVSGLDAVWMTVTGDEKIDPSGHAPGNSGWGFRGCAVTRLDD